MHINEAGTKPAKEWRVSGLQEGGQTLLGARQVEQVGPEGAGEASSTTM